MLKVTQTADGHNPFDEIECPVCEHQEFVSVDHAAVYCDNCDAQIQIRPTTGDPGYVAICTTEHVWQPSVKYPELLGKRIIRVVKIGEYDTKWTIPDETNWEIAVDEYVRRVRREHLPPAEELIGAYVRYRSPVDGKSAQGWVQSVRTNGTVVIRCDDQHKGGHLVGVEKQEILELVAAPMAQVI